MRLVVLWGLLPLLCRYTLVSSHSLGRSSSPGDLAELKSLLERFEETLAEAAQEDTSEMDYATMNQEPERGQSDRGWNTQQDRDQEPATEERSQAVAEVQNRALSARNRLLDLLVTARKRASGCFGARMDRIGNASGLGCNTARG
ncbi:natriuretic peptides A isoform X2 [Hippocampus comes]|uniref:Natriuretic peptides A-like n=1 Tax=Hippocampus comes TaxID=109280 RepID=A0A3Q2Z1Q8_HIPCM|nr:PREDICTED: natriuretic peptides A-like isoform X1 [Hippocampus comes]XP_019746232.1 PREDICTED: natriuretic peptides A-like isoform X2 [Hippocampus comes]